MQRGNVATAAGVAMVLAGDKHRSPSGRALRPSSTKQCQSAVQAEQANRISNANIYNCQCMDFFHNLSKQGKVQCPSAWEAKSSPLHN